MRYHSSQILINELDHSMSAFTVVKMHDLDVRTALYRKVLADHTRDPSTVVINEMGLLNGEGRVDIAVINGRMHGFEIKSKLDTLQRLPRQIDQYSRVFDKVTLVVDKSHLVQSLKMIPSWWGVIEVDQGSRKAILFKCHRRAILNQHVDVRSAVEFLWSEEASELLAKRNALKGYRGKPRWDLYDRIVATVSAQEILTYVRVKLKMRQEWIAGHGFSTPVPEANAQLD